MLNTKEITQGFALIRMLSVSTTAPSSIQIIFYDDIIIIIKINSTVSIQTQILWRIHKYEKIGWKLSPVVFYH